MIEAPVDWKTHGVKVIARDSLATNTPQTPGMNRAAAINHARVGAQKIRVGTVQHLRQRQDILGLGSSRALNEALQHATAELMRWWMKSYGFDEPGASLLTAGGY